MSRWEWGWFPPSVPRAAKGGIKARSQRGQFGATWWSQRWLAVLDSFGWSARMSRGRSYARRGQVLDFKIARDKITARVQGSQVEPYDVSIKLRHLTDKQWDSVINAMHARAAFAAKLLAGALPPEAEDVFKATKVPLFPQSGRDFDADCSCPDWVDCCKHIAAVHYLLAEQFDRDPFMVFALRGRTREQVLAALDVKPATAARRAAPAAPAEPLSVERFWKPSPAFTQVRVEVAPPAVELAVLRRLGDPVFAQGRGDRVKRLQAVYHAASRWAVHVSRS